VLAALAEDLFIHRREFWYRNGKALRLPLRRLAAHLWMLPWPNPGWIKFTTRQGMDAKFILCACISSLLQRCHRRDQAVAKAAADLLAMAG
jgi:hypothetical protein